MKLILMCLLSLLMIETYSASQDLVSIEIPGGAAGVGFDDLRFSSKLNEVLVPAGRTGLLVLIDPKNHNVTTISGFSSQKDYGSGHGEGITSVDEGRGLLFVVDRSAKKLDVVDSSSKKILTSANLASSPDYVRYVGTLEEIWVTEPDSDRIEIFSLSQDASKLPVHSAFLSIPGGPEALVVDQKTGRAYTHLWEGKTVVINLQTKKITATWPNGCEGSRGLSMDETGSFLFVGCKEGKAVSMDLSQNGKILSEVKSGAGVDIIDYDPKLHHLYLPGATSATMAILNVSKTGTLSLIRTVPTVEGAHCVISDHSGNAYVCDPHHGKILIIPDQN